MLVAVRRRRNGSALKKVRAIKAEQKTKFRTIKRLSVKIKQTAESLVLILSKRKKGLNQ